MFDFARASRRSLSGWAKGSGRSKTALTTLKIAVLAPMPSASVRMATAVKPEFLRSVRTPKRKSAHNDSGQTPRFPLVLSAAPDSAMVFLRAA